MIGEKEEEKMVAEVRWVCLKEGGARLNRKS